MRPHVLAQTPYAQRIGRFGGLGSWHSESWMRCCFVWGQKMEGKRESWTDVGGWRWGVCAMGACVEIGCSRAGDARGRFRSRLPLIFICDSYSTW